MYEFLFVSVGKFMAKVKIQVMCCEAKNLIAYSVFPFKTAFYTLTHPFAE